MKMEQKQAKWRNSFIILLALNLIIIVVISYGLFAPIPKQDLVKDIIPPETDHVTFVVQTTTDDVSEIVNAYLETLLAEENYRYYVTLNEDVQIQGDLPFFAATVPFHIVLEPLVLDNGNLLLKQKSLSLGQFNLPNQQAMKYVAGLLEVPEWVVIDPSKEEVAVQITDMKTKNNIRLYMEQFDLMTNEITLKIGLPLNTLSGDIEDKLSKK